jgi:hypothetical protein
MTMVEIIHQPDLFVDDEPDYRILPYPRRTDG